MYFWVISIFPEMFSAIHDYGITGRAFAEQKASLTLINPREFAVGNYRRVDDRVFGGGPGMVMLAEPLSKAIQFAKDDATTKGCVHCPVVYLSPQGEQLSESWIQSAQKTHQYDGLILLCGRYEGIDERVVERFVDIELSVGDYVLTGGELPAMIVLDTLIRRLPAVMGDDRSAMQDSFVDGLLDCPHYTRPVVFDEQKVPEVLLSGHHANIAKWRFFEQLKRTKQKRPELFDNFLDNTKQLSKEQKKWLNAFLKENGNCANNH